MADLNEKLSQEDIEDLVAELQFAKRKYEKKKGTYMSGIPNRRYTDQANENRITAAITSIDSVLFSYEKTKTLTQEQIVFSRKMIKKAFSLGLNISGKEE